MVVVAAMIRDKTAQTDWPTNCNFRDPLKQCQKICMAIRPSERSRSVGQQTSIVCRQPELMLADARIRRKWHVKAK